MSIRGIRGAVVASRDEPEAILAATRALISAIIEANPGPGPGRRRQRAVYRHRRPERRSTRPWARASSAGTKFP